MMHLEDEGSDTEDTSKTGTGASHGARRSTGVLGRVGDLGLRRLGLAGGIDGAGRAGCRAAGWVEAASRLRAVYKFC